MVTKLLSKENNLQLAEDKMLNGASHEAEHLLQAIVEHVPAAWKPLEEKEGKTIVHCWDRMEFNTFCDTQKQEKKDFIFSGVSYSKAFYLLAKLSMQSKDFGSALFYANKGLSLQADHPKLLCVKAEILCSIGNQIDGQEYFTKALKSQKWTDASLQAEILRKSAHLLNNLDKTEEAKDLYTKSLELDPENQKAMNELSDLYLNKASTPDKKKGFSLKKLKLW